MGRVQSGTEDLQLWLLTQLILHRTILDHKQKHSSGENLKAMVATVAPSVARRALLSRAYHSLVQRDGVV